MGSSTTTVFVDNLASSEALATKKANAKVLLSPSLSAVEKDGGPPTVAIDNQQVNWIASNSDVYAFFTALLSEHPDIDGGLFDAAAELFGLEADGEDAQADLGS
jgi:hypothetical protein